MSTVGRCTVLYLPLPSNDEITTTKFEAYFREKSKNEQFSQTLLLFN